MGSEQHQFLKPARSHRLSTTIQHTKIFFHSKFASKVNAEVLLLET